MARTARDLIDSAYRLIGVKGRGRNLSAEDSIDGLEALNDLLAGWSEEQLTIPTLTQNSGIALTPGVSEYTVSPTGSLAISTPVSIAELEIKDGADTYILTEFASFKDYLRSAKLGAGLPTGYFYERGKLYMGAKPDKAYNLVIWSYNPHAPFVNLSTDSALSDAHSPAIRYNLAIDLAPMFGKEPKSAVVKKAYDYKFAVETRHHKPGSSESDIGHRHMRSGIEVY